MRFIVSSRLELAYFVFNHFAASAPEFYFLALSDRSTASLHEPRGGGEKRSSRREICLILRLSGGEII